MKFRLTAVIVLALCLSNAFADEGMWLLGNLRKNSAFFINFCIDTEFPEDFPHDCLLVVGIIDGKITAKSQHFNMSA